MLGTSNEFANAKKKCGDVGQLQLYHKLKRKI
jgi:hypothetical protein